MKQKIRRDRNIGANLRKTIDFDYYKDKPSVGNTVNMFKTKTVDRYSMQNHEKIRRKNLKIVA